MIIDGMGGERVVEQHVSRVCDFELTIVTEYKYIGICLQNSGLDKAMNNKICKAKQWYGHFSSIAIMYGLEALSGNTAWINKSEKFKTKLQGWGLGQDTSQR